MKVSTTELKAKLSQQLPGKESHKKMAPASRESDILKRQQAGGSDARLSAVLLLLNNSGDSSKLVLIRRSSYEGVHSGQMGFPGGKHEPTDKDLCETALRETEEEIGISRSEIEIAGSLTDIYIPVSNFKLSVYVGSITKIPHYRINKRELDEVIEIPVAEFMKPRNIKHKEFSNRTLQKSTIAPYYSIQNTEIWGASAMIISEFIDLLLL